MRHNRFSWLLCLLCAAACGGDPDDTTPEPDPDPPMMIGPESPTSRVKFKGNDRLRNDMARALELEFGAGDVCDELGRYSCTHDAHKVALGGSAPYDLGLFDPLPATTASTPIAVDRVALSACITRVDRDLGRPGSAVWFTLTPDNAGELPDVDDPSVAERIDELYKRAVQRPATDDEIARHRQLYRDVEAASGTRPARDWAVLACFAVMSSMEQVFY